VRGAVSDDRPYREPPLRRAVLAGKRKSVLHLAAPPEFRDVEIFAQTLEFVFDFGFAVDFWVEDLRALGGGGGADRGEGGLIVGNEFDDSGFFIVGGEPGKG